MFDCIFRFSLTLVTSLYVMAIGYPWSPPPHGVVLVVFVNQIVGVLGNFVIVNIYIG